MFQDKDRAAKTGGVDTSPQRVKRFKSFALGAAFAALAVSQTAIAQEACPTGPKKATGVDGNWDIIKTRDFGLWAGSPERQVMLCVHRGLHSNIDDDTNGELGPVTKGIPEHSWSSIRNAFKYAPCVELDFQKRGLNYIQKTFGASHLILSHEQIGNRIMSQYQLRLAYEASIPSNCDTNTYSFSDVTGEASVTCKGANQYSSVYNSYRQPAAPIKFNSNFVEDAANINKNIFAGSLKTSWSEDFNGTDHDLVDFKALMRWVNDCRGGGNVGLVVADIKTYEALDSFVTEFSDFVARLPSAQARQDFARHWMIKTKPWKMRDPLDISGLTFTSLSTYVKKMKDLDVPVIDTIAQSGKENSLGATLPSPQVDADLADEYYIRSTKDNFGASGRRAVEIVVPGTSRYDPIRSGNQKIHIASDCKPVGYGFFTLKELIPIAKSCHVGARAGLNKSYFPQIWGWVPLEDGRAKNLYYSNGTSATPALPLGKYYVKAADGKYPFGVASSNAAPFPFVIGKDTEERNNNYVTDTLQARAITIDSVARFRAMFPGYTTNQFYFMQP